MIFITVIMKASVRYFSRKGIDRHRLHESVPVHRTEADAPGLYCYRARYYSPPMGGFINEDQARSVGR